MKAHRVIPILALLASSCSTAPVYVEADAATYAAVAPEYSAYVTADPALTAAQKARRLATVASWKKRIASAQAQAR